MSELIRRLLLASALFAIAVTPAAAQDFPSRPIHIICGYPAGSGADLVVRFFADQLTPLAGSQVIVDNKAGALTSIAAETVARARPDGYTLIITAGNSTFAGNPHMFKKLSYDPINDFAPVTTLMRLPFMLTVNAKTPVNSVSELTSYLKAKGEKVSFGYASTFSLASAELYKKAAGIPGVKVAYKGMPEAVADLIAGETDFQFTDAAYALSQFREGRIKLLAVTSADRLSSAAAVPSMIESGIPDFDLSGWWAAWAPANTPRPVVDKLAGWFNQIIAKPENKKYMNEAVGADPWPGSPEMLATVTASEIEKWGRIFKLANIEPQ
jgi:tripartite-type tricarboxylate transporter receptor subunit TctC